MTTEGQKLSRSKNSRSKQARKWLKGPNRKGIQSKCSRARRLCCHHFPPCSRIARFILVHALKHPRHGTVVVPVVSIWVPIYIDAFGEVCVEFLEGNILGATQHARKGPLPVSHNPWWPVNCFWRPVLRGLPDPTSRCSRSAFDCTVSRRCRGEAHYEDQNVSRRYLLQKLDESRYTLKIPSIRYQWSACSVEHRGWRHNWRVTAWLRSLGDELTFPKIKQSLTSKDFLLSVVILATGWCR